MIRAFQKQDLNACMQIWLDGNIAAHHFIAKEYWIQNYEAVAKLLPEAELYVYEEAGLIEGFIGLTGNYIAGIFVKEAARSKGIGRQLTDYAKGIKLTLNLQVYARNTRAVSFYQREGFVIQKEGIDESTEEKEFVMSWQARNSCRTAVKKSV